MKVGYFNQCDTLKNTLKNTSEMQTSITYNSCHCDINPLFQFSDGTSLSIMSCHRFNRSAVNLARFSTFSSCSKSAKLYTVGFLCSRFNGFLLLFLLSSNGFHSPPPTHKPDRVADERLGYNLYLLHISSFTPYRIPAMASRYFFYCKTRKVALEL